VVVLIAGLPKSGEIVAFREALGRLLPSEHTHDAEVTLIVFFFFPQLHVET
jgi:hypothetical protein